MAAFYRFQRVRVVRSCYAQIIGQECTLLEPRDHVYFDGARIDGPAWRVDLAHPETGYAMRLGEFQIEPLRYLPSPEDFVSLERVPPDFNLPLPVRV